MEMSDLHITEDNILVDHDEEVILGVGQFDTDGDVDVIDFIVR